MNSVFDSDMAARHVAVGNGEAAKRFGLASVIISLIGIVVSVIIIGVVCGVELSNNKSPP